MARKTSGTLTEAELEIMEVLWRQESATVASLLPELPAGKNWAYNTLLTFLRILERKGFVRHTKTGRAFIYHPLLKPGEARRTALRDLMHRFFQGSPELLVQNMLADASLKPEELAKIRSLIEEGYGEEP